MAYRILNFAIVRCLAALVVLLCAVPASADSWTLPTQQIYLSADKRTRLIVTPRDLSGPLDYFEDKVDGTKPAGQRTGGNDKARGRLEQKDAAGAWVTLWAKPLVNDVSPVSALVANSGSYVVTFDNWHRMGHGDDAVVIYDASGTVVRALSLTDFLPKDYVSALSHSVSSIGWGGQHALDQRNGLLNLKVTVPEKDLPDEKQGTVNIFIDLATGAPKAPTGDAWDAALKAAARRNVAAAAYEIARVQFLTEPLINPKINDEGEWHHYLREGFARVTADWLEDSTSTTVLRSPSAKDYAVSRKWIKEALLESYADNVSIATLDPANLVVVLKRTLNPMAAGRLKHLTVYIAVNDEHWPQIQAVFAKSGAKLVQLNPEKPIAQNSERLAKLTAPVDADN